VYLGGDGYQEGESTLRGGCTRWRECTLGGECTRRGVVPGWGSTFASNVTATNMISEPSSGSTFHPRSTSTITHISAANTNKPNFSAAHSVPLQNPWHPETGNSNHQYETPQTYWPTYSPYSIHSHPVSYATNIGTNSQSLPVPVYTNHSHAMPTGHMLSPTFLSNNHQGHPLPPQPFRSGPLPSPFQPYQHPS
jgi:hypothetical protein